MNRHGVLVVALVLAVGLAGCSEGFSEQTPASESAEGGPDASPATPTHDAERQPGETSESFRWSILRTVGLELTDGTVGRLTTVLSNPSDGASLDAENVTLLLGHEGESYRVVHQSVADNSADGSFTIGDPRLETELYELRPDARREFVVEFDDEEGAVPIELEPGETVSVLVRAPNGTTRTATGEVPSSLEGEHGIVLSGEYRDLDAPDERDVTGQLRVVSGTADRLTPAGAGVVNLTVTTLPGSGPVDYRNVSVRLSGPNGSYRLVHPGRGPEADGHVGVTPVRDDDESFPILNDRDRFRLTLDLGPDAVDVDDGPAGDSVGTPLGRSFGTVLFVTTGDRSRRLDVAVPTNATEGPVDLRGVQQRGEGYPETRQQPAVSVVTSDRQRLADGAFTGLSLNVRNPPTADPLNVTRFTVEVETGSWSYSLVHPSRTGVDADGHFGVEPVFNPDGSHPVLDDYVDLARLTLDLGPDTREGDDGPLGSSVGEPIEPGTLVTVTVRTDDGVETTRQYYVDD